MLLRKSSGALVIRYSSLETAARMRALTVTMEKSVGLRDSEGVELTGFYVVSSKLLFSGFTFVSIRNVNKLKKQKLKLS